MIIHRSRTTPCPKDTDLRNDSCREGEKEHTYKKIPGQILSNKSLARLARQYGHKQPTPTMQCLKGELYHYAKSALKAHP
jgi:hypothetical protein